MHDIIFSQTHCGSRGPRSPAPAGPGEQCQHPFLAEMANWPSVDEVFTLRSLELLQGGGVQAWQQAGGQLSFSRRPTLQFFSPHTQGIVQQLVSGHGGIQFTDVAESQWCLQCMPSAPSGGTLWIGIGGGCLNYLLGTGCRRAAAAELGHEFARRRDYRDASFEQWLPYHRRLRDLLHETRRYERAACLLPVIMRHTKASRLESIRIPEIELARHYFRADRSQFPPGWSSQLLGALALLATITVHSYELPAGSWSPPRATFQHAMSAPQWRSGHISLTLMSAFYRFFKPLFCKPTSKRGNRRSPCHVTPSKTGLTK